MKWKDYFKVSLSKYYVNIIIGYGWISIMFVVIVLIYILMELLVGIMVFLFGIEGGESYFFYFLLYFYVGDIIDMIVFFNVILNFFVYFCISKQYCVVLKVFIWNKFFKIYEISVSYGEYMGFYENMDNMEFFIFVVENIYRKF